jgi:hypothetical protein
MFFGLPFQFGGFVEGFDRNTPDNSESFPKSHVTDISNVVILCNDAVHLL